MKAKILLADDDEEVPARLDTVLESEQGYRRQRRTPSDQHFHEEHIDIALLDLNMPVRWLGDI